MTHLKYTRMVWLLIGITLIPSGCGILNAVSNSLDKSSIKLPVYEGVFEGNVVAVAVRGDGGMRLEAAALEVISRPEGIRSPGRFPSEEVSDEEFSTRFIEGVFEDEHFMLLVDEKGQVLPLDQFQQRRIAFRGRLAHQHGMHAHQLDPVDSGMDEGHLPEENVSRDASLIVLRLLESN